MTNKLTDRNPYLIRAMHEWITNNNLTPHIEVDCTIDGVIVPDAYISNNSITLNIAYDAVSDLTLSNDVISFAARFNGITETIFLPPASVTAIFTKENGEGMMMTTTSPTSKKEVIKKKPTLSLVH